MKQHRGHWSRGAWPKKASPLEEAHSSLWLKSLPMRNAVKDESGTWTEIVRVEDSGGCWDSQAFDISFFDDNKKIFQWDDRGALDYLKKVEVKLQQGISSVYADYLNDSNQFSASIDWDERRLCTLPDCAEDLVNRDEKRKILRGSFTRRDPSDSVNAVIFGLPEPQNGTGCSSTPSLRLPLDFVPFPTGWDDGEDNPAEALCEDLPLQPLTATDATETLVQPPPGPLTATDAKETQLQPPPRSLWHASMNSSQVPRIPGLGWPEYPSSYQHIIPSGWEDVQVDQPVVPLRCGALALEPRLDVQTRPAGAGGCYNPSYNCRPAWGKPHASSESHPVYIQSHSGKEQDLYHCRYWRPKRGSETNYHESGAPRTMQRSGRSISTKHRVNHNPRSPRTRRAERAKAQWSSANTPTHGTELVAMAKQGEI